MLDQVSGLYSVGLPSIAVLALLPALPLLALAYIGHSLRLRSVRAEFALRKSELAELRRALALHQKVCFRMEKARALAPGRRRLWRALMGARAGLSGDKAVEYEDLQAHAEFLQMVVFRLRARPLRRLKTWIHRRSLHSALGWVLATDAIAFLAIVVLSADQPGQAGWASAGLSSVDLGALWDHLDGQTLYANAMSAAFALAASPLFYLARRLRLHRQHKLEFRLFRDLASLEKAVPFEHLRSDDAREPPQAAEGEQAADDWRSVLHVSQSATAEEIRAAYRLAIKQCHPDRVHGMSDAFRRLAEAETKRLNLAYQQALVAMASA